MRTELTMRDLNMLMYVFENRVATSDQLHRKFFSHTKKESSAARNRIRMLHRGDYLRPCLATVDQKVHRYYQITEQAFQYIRESWDIDIDAPKFRSESPYHDIRLNDLRFVFEKLKLFEKYYPENMLQSATVLQQELRTEEAARIQSDGILLLKHTDSTQFNYAVELETSKKNLDRFEKKLSSSDILKLQWKDLNLKTRAIGLNRSSDLQLREFIMSDELLLAIKRIQPIGDFVFTNLEGKPLRKFILSRELKRFQRRSQLSTNWGLRDLRATFAAHYLQGGGSIKGLQKLMGHKSFHNTQEVYGRYSAVTTDIKN